MKTKNRKWIGPVPITLVVVFALAAFLSVGLLLATNGVQPVAAQGDADCLDQVDWSDETTDDTADKCNVRGVSATVAVVGHDTRGDDGKREVYIYAENGRITGGTELRDMAVPGANTLTTLSFRKLELGGSSTDGRGNVIEDKETITVTPNRGENTVSVYVYYVAEDSCAS